MMVEFHFQTQEFLRVLKFAMIVLACFEYILGQIMLEIKGDERKFPKNWQFLIPSIPEKFGRHSREF